MNAVVRAFLFEYFLHSAYKVWAWDSFLLGARLMFGPGILGVSLETLGSFVIVVVCFFPLFRSSRPLTSRVTFPTCASDFFQ